MVKIDIIIRDVDPIAVKKIDELFKKKGFKSRQDFLKNYVESLSFSNKLQNILDKNNDRYINLLNTFEFALEKNTTVLEKINNILDEGDF
ncbi:MAG: hypothetical protein PHX70_13745 [Clostridium sp.]|nr:hypothetical protein [Clostridium sp.]